MAGMLEWRPSLLPDLVDWIESGLGGLPVHRTAPGVQGIRIEEQLTEDAYTLRAELPGLDPEKDLEISVTGDVLTLRAERSEDTARGHRTEFRYGTYARAVRLPAGALTEDTGAEYKDGILTVTVPLAKADTAGTRTIPVRRETP
ncbi:Hsp20/alpha crystallin family protein [Streptomyces sp. VRA16 Mangrove soil]|uniref:Hsp20/alpha crystallin family protein n=1 Tax=Streptomyces sp. VRA16 Mangrove soil TaxID=2817434 RepID=UPI001A9FC67B|nr:Hsp20/alpha crystallin family protein [Streptomyces sp. VRA16 Mangrove soil]MBO1337932.1 Hsp20/alpha crystallin family protein [Streptomyces sp. VRA16 Mangrove soil]